MAIRIVPHSEEFRAAAEAFNQRMATAGSPWGVCVDPEPDWLPKRSGLSVWQEHYVAVDDLYAVHGGYTLKPQQWLVRGATTIVTDWQGPISEGSIDSRYSTLAIRLIRDMADRRPELFSWGHGGTDQPIVQMLRKMNWLIHATPFCLLVLKPFRFLRLNAFLRGSAPRRLAQDLAAFSGVGSVGLRAVHLALRLKAFRSFAATASTFDRFDSWADDLWASCKDKYSVIAFRDANSMNALAPHGGWPQVIRLRIEKSGKTIGWSLVMSTPMRDDTRFGKLHVGSIVDCLADPRDAGEVVWASTRFLRATGVDIVVSNQSHPGWLRGFAENGYALLPNRRLFVAAPALRQLLEPIEETSQGLHLTNMDGHGPHLL